MGNVIVIHIRGLHPLIQALNEPAAGRSQSCVGQQSTPIDSMQLKHQAAWTIIYFWCSHGAFASRNFALPSSEPAPLRDRGKRRSGQFGMGIISGSFRFLLGTGFGIYLAQNYNIPDLKKLIDKWRSDAERIDKDYRKPTKSDD
ncbi:hypothetical protein Cni_G23818 [Canna indica]|uniref:Uncharacterized protein n=1 Tax=Canna indica TaxID=4628 RepID=A0AAQ3KWX6_9LILI|nr:hypothetical protein Cni_G23818 [Canna indica]